MEKKGAKVLHMVKKGPHMVEKVPNKEKIANKPPPQREKVTLAMSGHFLHHVYMGK